MVEIDFINPKRMNNGAHFVFVGNTLKQAESDEKLSTKLATQIARLKAAVEQEDKDLKISQKSLTTDDIAAADKERDHLYRSYKKAVKGFLNFPMEDKAKAAKVLNQHLKDYAIDPKMQLDRETGMLDNLITDIETKYSAEAEALMLTDVVSQLKDANEKVRSLITERAKERSNITVGALHASREASDEAYTALVKAVNALITIEGEADYEPFVKYMNTEIARYKRNVLGQHSSQSGTGDDGKTTPSGTTGDGDGKDSSTSEPTGTTTEPTTGGDSQDSSSSEQA